MKTETEWTVNIKQLSPQIYTQRESNSFSCMVKPQKIKFPHFFKLFFSQQWSSTSSFLIDVLRTFHTWEGRVRCFCDRSRRTSSAAATVNEWKFFQLRIWRIPEPILDRAQKGARRLNSETASSSSPDSTLEEITLSSIRFQLRGIAWRCRNSSLCCDTSSGRATHLDKLVYIPLRKPIKHLQKMETARK